MTVLPACASPPPRRRPPRPAAAAACGAPSALAPSRLCACRVACVARLVARLACVARLGRLLREGLARLGRLGSGRYFVPEHL